MTTIIPDNYFLSFNSSNMMLHSIANVDSVGNYTFVLQTVSVFYSNIVKQ